MPVSLSPDAASTLKWKSAAISAGYLNLSTFRFRQKPTRAAAYFTDSLLEAKP
jgi:hypothetical protein